MNEQQIFVDSVHARAHTEIGEDQRTVIEAVRPRLSRWTAWRESAAARDTACNRAAIGRLFPVKRGIDMKRIIICLVAVSVACLPALMLATPSGADTGPPFLNGNGIPIATPPPPQQEQLPSGIYNGRPLGVPSGPQSSLASCPQDPSWSPALPAGDTVAVSLAPAGSEGALVNGTKVSTVGYCAYTVTPPATASTTAAVKKSGTAKRTDPTTYVNLGDQNVPYGSDWNFDVFNNYGSECYTTGLLINGYGDAFAEQELDSGYCNTTYAAAGYVIAVNTAEQEALVDYEYPYFGYWYASYEGGSIFFGIFQECMENPVGQSSDFLCYDMDAGPLL
jgi:hypothetical protein